jgi:ribulose-phosphate 3-epimerase
MKSRIVPALLETRYHAITSKVARIAGLVPIIQVDITDGKFVPSITYGRSGKVSVIKHLVHTVYKHKLQVELDLMIDLDQPKAMTRWSDALVQAKPDRVVFHLGSTYRWDELFERLRHKTKQTKLPFTCGLAVRISHTRNEIRKVLEAHSEFEYIQLMGIEKVGYSGQSLSPKVYERIRRIRRAFPDMPIQIDGGVKEANAPKLFTAGADRVGMNSGLFKSDDIADVIDRVNAI